MEEEEGEEADEEAAAAEEERAVLREVLGVEMGARAAAVDDVSSELVEAGEGHGAAAQSELGGGTAWHGGEKGLEPGAALMETVARWRGECVERLGMLRRRVLAVAEKVKGVVREKVKGAAGVRRDVVGAAAASGAVGLAG